MTSDATKPLAGIRVVDLTTNMSGPMATMVLADQGADVVKIEPPQGDSIRNVGSGSVGLSAYFANNNRGKRSIALDLTSPRGREIVEGLLVGADVFVQNFRPGVVERLGLGEADLRPRHPRLVYASISGFGRLGPLADAPAYDHVVQALSGFVALQSADGEPAMVRHGVIDKATALTLAQAVTAALFARTTTGVGTRIDVSMLDAAIAFLWPDGMMDHTVESPEVELPPTSRSFRVTPTADGHIVLVTLTGDQWARLGAAVLDESDTTGGETADRMRGGGAVMRQVRAKLATMPTDEAVRRLREADLPVAPVLALDEVADHEQVVANDTVAAFEHGVLGPVHQPRPAPLFDGRTVAFPHTAPRLSEHADAILTELGYDAEAITDLRAAGIVG